jgi:hypothetical protein
VVLYWFHGLFVRFGIGISTSLALLLTTPFAGTLALPRVGVGEDVELVKTFINQEP